ncbi:hypothetical protein MNBD_GAMMA26-1861, partial [hydrothermal vent metagenome]
AELKYDSINGINAIDYSDNQNSQVLQYSYTDRFKSILDKFGISINDEVTN